MNIKGKRVTLRAIEPSDIEFMRELINDPDMEKSIVGWIWPLSSRDQQSWYNNYKNTLQEVRFIIESHTDGIIGFTGLKDIDMKNGMCRTGGLRIAPNFQGKGYAKDSYIALLSYAFNQLRMHCVQSCALEDNVASLTFMERLGYVREGLRRECVYKNGKYYNLVELGILEKEFRQKWN